MLLGHLEGKRERLDGKVCIEVGKERREKLLSGKGLIRLEPVAHL